MDRENILRNFQRQIHGLRRTGSTTVMMNMYQDATPFVLATHDMQYNARLQDQYKLKGKVRALSLMGGGDEVDGINMPVAIDNGLVLKLTDIALEEITHLRLLNRDTLRDNEVYGDLFRHLGKETYTDYGYEFEERYFNSRAMPKTERARLVIGQALHLIQKPRLIRDASLSIAASAVSMGNMVMNMAIAFVCLTVIFLYFCLTI